LKCVCGKEAVKPTSEISELIDVVTWSKDGLMYHDKLCLKCHQRVAKLWRKFKTSIIGIAYIVRYDKENDLFTISTYNEYGDRAYLSERQKQTVSAIKNLYTGETIFMEGDEITGVF